MNSDIARSDLMDIRAESPGKFCDELFCFLTEYGDTHYDEAVTQLVHALQSAELAERAGYPAAMQVAALLHDIGHLFVDEHGGRTDFLADDLRHEIIGARFLSKHFGQKVAGPVALHVPAKRYLVAVDPNYYAGLSSASKASLAVQGGPMSDDEVKAFIALPHWRHAIELRRWDDQAKQQRPPATDLEHWRSAIFETLL